MNIIEDIHGKYVFNRQVRVLSEQLAKLMPQNSRVLDVGCGDGFKCFESTTQCLISW